MYLYLNKLIRGRNMNTVDLIKQARRIIESSRQSSGAGILSEAMEFFRIYTGDKSTFFKQLSKVDQGWRDEKKNRGTVLCLTIPYYS